MIELKEIRRENNKILCEAFVEDSTQAISIIYDVLKDCFDEGDLPAGYEWCKVHIGYAEHFIKGIKDVSDIPNNKVIMWY